MPVKSIPKKPVPKKPVKPVDYKIIYQNGEMDKFNPIVRCEVVDENNLPVKEFKVEDGFGSTEDEARKDFIRRNSSTIINRIFDLK